MRALNRKLGRDLRQMWSQALTIALVVASGIGGFLTTLSAVDSLALARDRFYAQARFADLFAGLKRAPLSLVDTLRQTAGVADVQPTVEAMVRITLPNSSDPVVGQLIGIDRRQPMRLNRVSLRGGNADAAVGSPGPPRADGALPVWVSEAFATVQGLKPGARLQALINGRQRTLEMAGVALSPEYIFAGLWGMPDQRGFGVFWIDREALAAAYDMEGAFNHVAVKLAPAADERAVIAALRAQLAPYGAREVNGREQQTSNAMLSDEIKGQTVMGTLLPSIFLAVAAFLLNVVVSRLVATQREQIAALKALGYANRSIAAHYLALVLVIVAIGLLLGLGLGKLLGTALTGLYAEVFRFPSFAHRMDPALVITGLGLTALTAVAGTLNAILASVRLTPAEAMRPPAPGRYRRTLLERLGLRRVPTSLRMILRQMERRPWRTLLAIVGVAAAVAIVILGNFFRDAIDSIVDNQFNLAMRNDVSVWTFDPLAGSARSELLRLPGVKQAEATRFVQVNLVHGHRQERVQIKGYASASQLYRVVDLHNRVLPLVGDGLVLTDRLARKLGLQVGDTVRAEVLEGRVRTLELKVDRLVPEMMGLNAYMRREALNQALAEGDIANGFVLALDRGAEAALLDATRRMPRVAGAFSKASMLRNMQEVSARSIRIMSLVLTSFAAVIAVGVVYNNARIALAERTWELASLRVLGFTRAEVSALLLGEMALSIALALPLGMMLGLGLVHGLAGAMATDQFQFPIVIQPRTYVWAGLCVLAAALASALVVRRRIDALDMVAALKTRE